MKVILERYLKFKTLHFLLRILCLARSCSLAKAKVYRKALCVSQRLLNLFVWSNTMTVQYDVCIHSSVSCPVVGVESPTSEEEMVAFMFFFQEEKPSGLAISCSLPDQRLAACRPVEASGHFLPSLSTPLPVPLYGDTRPGATGRQNLRHCTPSSVLFPHFPCNCPFKDFISPPPPLPQLFDHSLSCTGGSAVVQRLKTCR